MYTYDTVTAAVSGLKARGYNLDFNLLGNELVCVEGKLNVDDFDIVEVYRFEGDSDPADEAVVYGVESHKGQKGIIVTGYGTSAEGLGADLAKKLSIIKE